MKRKLAVFMVCMFVFLVMLGVMEEFELSQASPYTTINVETAYNMITNGSYPELVLLDVRTKSEYDSGHIYGTVWIPHTELEARIGELAGHENDEIMVYCLSGGRSATASNILESYNFTKVYNMGGGITAWNLANYPIWTATIHNLNSTYNYDMIQAAINAGQTLDGHTILVEEGIYHENIFLNKMVRLVGADKENTIIDGDANGTVVDIVVDNINLSHFTIRNSGTDPYSPDSGLRLINASNCLLVNNTIERCLHAIFMLNSSMNALRNNCMLNNNYSLNVWGLKLSDYVNDIDITNTVDGQLIYYLINQTSLTINPLTFPNAGYLALVNSTRITVENLSFTRASQAILFSYTTNSTIKAVQIQDGYSGIFLYASHNNLILQNSMTRCWEEGISLISSENNTVSENTISYGEQHGIILGNSSKTVISHNEISYTKYNGVWISWSPHNTLLENTLSHNQYSAIELRYSANNNTIAGNNIINNVIPIKIEDSNFNGIFHNNFIQNEYGASSTWPNFWDNGYISGGNYWNDYTGIDLHRGSHQNETGRDGIGDTPYLINFDCEDNYPLMGMFSDFKATSEHHIQTICNSTISNFQYNETAVSFNVTGEKGTIGFCRMLIPTALMNETYRVFVNGTEVSYDLLPFSNTAHSYLYFTYNHSTQEVIVIPEFPSLIILPLFMMGTLLVVIACGRKRRTILEREADKI